MVNLIRLKILKYKTLVIKDKDKLVCPFQSSRVLTSLIDILDVRG